MDSFFRLLLLGLLVASSCPAQFQTIKIWFTDIGCESCSNSLSERIGRLRGVQSVQIAVKEGKIEISLTDQNRVRLEQIRDLVEQDGSKTTRAFVRVRGNLSNMDNTWTLQPAGVSSKYEVVGSDLKPGALVISGDVRDLHPGASPMRIEVAKLEKEAAKSEKTP